MNPAFLNAVGWVSSLILFLTICKQIYKQWSEHTSKGVSKWLFMGQIFSSIGFVIYSWGVHNRVFVISNLFLLVSNFVGLSIVLRHRRLARRQSGHDAVNSEAA